MDKGPATVPDTLEARICQNSPQFYSLLQNMGVKKLLSHPSIVVM